LKERGLAQGAETIPISMAVHGVIPEESAFLLLTKSAIFDRHLYPMPANAKSSQVDTLP
jgi:ABC-type uncharacterized transport system YnjBCD substrate-binding protein